MSHVSRICHGAMKMECLELVFASFKPNVHTWSACNGSLTYSRDGMIPVKPAAHAQSRQHV